MKLKGKYSGHEVSIVDEICNVQGRYLAYDEATDTYYQAVITFPRAKITITDEKNGVPVVNIMPEGNEKLLYYIGLTEEE
jgi:hypothetical protein